MIGNYIKERIMNGKITNKYSIVNPVKSKSEKEKL